MAGSRLEKYFRSAVTTVETPHPEVTSPRLSLKSNENFGNLKFSMSWWAIKEPFEMVSDHHAHDFDQYLIFVGGDINNMVDLGGEVELTLSEDGINKELFTITEATNVFIPKGLYHCPLNFKRVNNPDRPILFHDLFFSPEYLRKS